MGNERDVKLNNKGFHDNISKALISPTIFIFDIKISQRTKIVLCLIFYMSEQNFLIWLQIR